MPDFVLQPVRDDGEYIPTVGPWSAQKHYFLRRYIHAFTTAMRSKKWVSVHYIDLFAGAGIERIKGRGLEWGSPLIAAQSPVRFRRLHLCERNEQAFRALQQRVTQFTQPTAPQILHADANQIVGLIVDAIPRRALSLAFLDPYGLHLHFDTLRQLATRRVDLLIFFPDHLDALRNWENVYAGKPDSNLDRVLGGVSWRRILQNAPRATWAHELRKIYERQIQTLGYRRFDYERISLPSGRFLYVLIFCTRSDAGLKIWKGIAGTKVDGQRSFDFKT
jgi:three-Cys-motif partner protein